MDQRSASLIEFSTSETDNERIGQPSLNLIAFRRRTWCRDGVERPGGCHDARRAAVTTLRFSSSGAEEVIAGADIELNAVHFTWSDEIATSSGQSTLRLSAVLAHELGHVLGFGHPCAMPGERKSAFADEAGKPLVACNARITHGRARSDGTSMLSPGAVSARGPLRLSHDDVEGLLAAYGSRPARSSCGVSLSARRTSGPWLLLIALVLGIRKLAKALAPGQRGVRKPEHEAGRACGWGTRHLNRGRWNEQMFKG